jgi:hypothetical protein
MAIVALKEAFGDTMMKGTGELCADVLMAGVAEFRRFGLHQELAFLGMMRRVTINAGNAVSQMHGSVVVAVLLVVLVTPQAPSAGFLRRNALERKYFRFVSTAIDVFFSGAMARLTTVPFRPFVGIQL